MQERKNIRLKAYDYSQSGGYFLTMCAFKKLSLFGEIVDGRMELNECGRIVQQYWLEIPLHFKGIQLDQHVIMPNHIHGIIFMDDDRTTWGNMPDSGTTSGGTPWRAPTHQGGRERFGKPLSGSISTIVRSFKSSVTNRINEQRNISGACVWQRGFYDHVIRDVNDLKRIREYVLNNPSQWAMDDENLGQVRIVENSKYAEVKKKGKIKMILPVNR
jgi:REP element-mobilizing transposase RayT